MKVGEEISALDQDTSANTVWEIFKDKLHSSIKANIPHKQLKHSNKLPWISRPLKNKMNKYKKLYFRLKKKGHSKTDNLRSLKSEIQKEQRAAYWQYIENMILDIPIPDSDSPKTKPFPKNLFSYMKSQKTDSQTIPPLRNNGLLKSGPTEKANILNDQFQKAFTPLTTDPIPNKGQSNHPTMPTIQVTLNGVDKLLAKIQPHKATGPDEIQGRVLKECKTAIAPVLTRIFNTSLKTGKIPDDWRHANVCPVYKKGDKHDAINYRPISLTCICSKLLEHIVSSNVMRHLEDNKILYDLQHGFRSSRSCETQLLSFVQELAKDNNDNIQTDIIIMDFAKAFDKVPHRHLIYKLNYYGIDPNTINWIRDFLSNRTQTVVLEGQQSNKLSVTSGVPQGTVLGPILFLIYINDLPDYMKHSTLRLFADDSIIYRQIYSTSDSKLLQLDLEAAGKWEQDWLMSFHPDKCSILSVTRKRSPITFSYNLHNHILQKVDSAKYLGLTLQSNLKWDKHITSITSKANQSLGFLKRNLKINSTHIKSHAYKALVRPKLEYGSVIWDPHNKQQINMIEKVQRRAARFASNRYHNTSSVTDMINELNWPPLEIRRIRSRLIMFYKITHQLVAINFSNVLIPLDPRTRHSHDFGFRHIYSHVNSYKFSFLPRTIVQWNLLPVNVVSCDTVDSFKTLIPVSHFPQNYLP